MFVSSSSTRRKKELFLPEILKVDISLNFSGKSKRKKRKINLGHIFLFTILKLVIDKCYRCFKSISLFDQKTGILHVLPGTGLQRSTYCFVLKN
jgi:hypothetical protein